MDPGSYLTHITLQGKPSLGSGYLVDIKVKNWHVMWKLWYFTYMLYVPITLRLSTDILVYGLHFQNKHLVCHFQSRLDKLGSCCCVAPFRSDLGSQIRSWISCVLLSALSKILRKSPPILASEVSLMRTSDSLITRFLFPVSPTSYTWHLVAHWKTWTLYCFQCIV